MFMEYVVIVKKENNDSKKYYVYGYLSSCMLTFTITNHINGLAYKISQCQA